MLCFCYLPVFHQWIDYTTKFFKIIFSKIKMFRDEISPESQCSFYRWVKYNNPYRLNILVHGRIVFEKNRKTTGKPPPWSIIPSFSYFWTRLRVDHSLPNCTNIIFTMARMESHFTSNVFTSELTTTLIYNINCRIFKF